MWNQWKLIYGPNHPLMSYSMPVETKPCTANKHPVNTIPRTEPITPLFAAYPKIVAGLYISSL